MTELLLDLMAFAGWVILVSGLAMWSVPLSMVVAGGSLFVFGLAGAWFLSIVKSASKEK